MTTPTWFFRKVLHRNDNRQIIPQQFRIIVRVGVNFENIRLFHPATDAVSANCFFMCELRKNLN